MRLREISLVRGRLDQIDGQRGEHLPVPTEWVLVWRQDSAPIRLNCLDQLSDSGRGRARGDQVRRNAA